MKKCGEEMTKEWAVFDRSGYLECLPICGETPRSVAVVGGAKVPHDRLWMRCDSDCASLLPEARTRAEQLDIEMLWRAAGGETLTPEVLAQRAGAEDLPAMLAVLQLALDNPAYFRRREGCLAPMEEEVLNKVRASLRRRAEEAALEHAILEKIAQSTTPPPEVMEARGALLTGEEKNSAVFRAAKKAAGGERYIPEWLVKIGACADARECWMQMFEHRWLPRPADVTPPAVPANLPESEARAFSIDEAGTFEVDDAFSVRALPGGDFVAGIHIAIPALDSSLFVDEEYDARRLTSVYFPGGVKHPMLPPAYMESYSLRAGCRRPALSLYYRFDRANGILGEMRTQADWIWIENNYRPEDFDGGAPKKVAEEYAILRDFAAMLPPLPGGGRTEFRISTSPPKVVAVERPQIGMFVEKMMRLTNSEWGRQISGNGGLFRAGGALSSRPDADHVYAWTSSPLRRYPDLANQRLLLSLHNIVPPPTIDWDKLASEYSSQQIRARHFQDLMERHWVLRALQELPDGTVLQARRQDKTKARLRDYPMAGALVNVPPCRTKPTPEEEMQVRLHDIDFFIQRARFEKL